MAVDSAERNGRPVQSQDKIFDFNFPKAYFLGNNFLFRIYDQGIQNRILRVPEERTVDLNSDAFCAESACPVTGSLPARPYRILIYYSGSVGTDQSQADRNGFPAEREPDFQISALQIIGKICLNDIVLDPVRRPVQEIDVPENAGEAELILIFQITPVTLLQNQDRQQVVSFPDEFCHVEL